MNNCPCNNCLVKVICKECCLELQLWSDSLSIEDKLIYLHSTRDKMKVVTPKIRRQFQKIKYGVIFG
jgi:hypothetical protein